MTREFNTIRFSVVDDDAYACSRLISLVETVASNFKLDRFYNNPVKALARLLEEKPDVLFLDVEMPELDGLSLSAKLREAGYTGKVIFTTAFDQYVLDALRNRAFDYLLKPVDKTELKQAIARIELDFNENYQNFQKLEEFGLTEREIEITKRIFMGLTSKEIGQELFISKHTVDTHRRNILTKTGCKNTTELFKLI
jgi:DNA-binding NarL/FixJ family response regulator